MADDHFRYTASDARFYFIDARAVLPLPLLLVIKSWLLAGFCFLLIGFFVVLERRGLTVPNFARKLRCLVVGSSKGIRHGR